MKSRRGSDRLHRHAAGVGALSLCSMLLATPASAHHAMGGATPPGWEGPCRASPPRIGSIIWPSSWPRD
jgi:hypothetical protein